MDHGLHTCGATHPYHHDAGSVPQLYINSMFNFKPSSLLSEATHRCVPAITPSSCTNNLTTKANTANPGRRFTTDFPPTLEILGRVGARDDVAAMGEGIRNALTSTAARRIAAENKNDRGVGMAARVVVRCVSGYNGRQIKMVNAPTTLDGGAEHGNMCGRGFAHKYPHPIQFIFARPLFVGFRKLSFDDDDAHRSRPFPRTSPSTDAVDNVLLCPDVIT